VLEHLPELRRSILLALARRGPLSVQELAPMVFGSVTNVRTVIRGMEEEELVSCTEQAVGRGRPRKVYRLTPHGWHLLPNRAARYATELVKLMSQRDPEAFREALLCVQDATVTGVLERVDLPPGQAALLRSLDLAVDDGWGVDAWSAEGATKAVFFHCPIFHLALEFPALCEAHAQTLAAIAGVPAELSEHRLSGDRDCVFSMQFASVVSDEGSE
jgi:predicted ArsR family transcriptional regulator